MFCSVKMVCRTAVYGIRKKLPVKSEDGFFSGHTFEGKNEHNSLILKTLQKFRSKFYRNMRFNSKNVRAVIEGTYFGWLLDVLESELPSTPGQKLYVIYLTIDRIFRPITYNPHGGISTWHYTDDDYAVFQMFLDYFFGERTSDIVFAVIDDSDPAKNRSNATKLGQATTGRRGGRPRQINPKEEACRLARENKWNAGRIRRHLFRYKIDASIRAFQLWLKNKGLESPPGRPKKEE